MTQLWNNLVDLKRVFLSGSFRRERFDGPYADKAEVHAGRDASHAEVDWVARARPPAASVLDIGCNTGRPLARLCRAWGAAGTGSDVNPCAVARARCDFPQLAFFENPGEQLPFADACFEHAMIHHVLGHVASPERTLAEALRVLVPGGTLSVVTPNAFYKLWQFPMNLLRNFPPDVTVLRYYSPASLGRELRKAGFRVEQILTSGISPALCPAPLTPGAKLRVVALARRPGGLRQGNSTKPAPKAAAASSVESNASAP